MTSDEEVIFKYFNDIQENFNLNLNEKLKWEINELLRMQLRMKIKYLIIKKIDFKDSILDSHGE